MLLSKSFNIEYSLLFTSTDNRYVLSKKKFILIPSFIEIDFSQKNILSVGIKDIKYRLEYTRFLRRLSLWVQLANKRYVKTLHLTGLGYKMFLIDNKTKIQFKLGYSHLVIKTIPRGLKVITFKNKIRVEGFNKAKVGNFLQNIRLLRMPNIYKGKGFWYKYQAKVLKEVKKK